jgi:hypothetical protein
MRRTRTYRKGKYPKHESLDELPLIDTALLDAVLRAAQCLLFVGLMLFC